VASALSGEDESKADPPPLPDKHETKHSDRPPLPDKTGVSLSSSDDVIDDVPDPRVTLVSFFLKKTNFVN